MALAILGWRLPARRRHRRPDILLMERPPAPFLLTSAAFTLLRRSSLFVNPSSAFNGGGWSIGVAVNIKGRWDVVLGILKLLTFHQESVNSLEMIGRSPYVVTVRHHNNVTWTRDPGLQCPNILCPTWQLLRPD